MRRNLIVLLVLAVLTALGSGVTRGSAAVPAGDPADRGTALSAELSALLAGMEPGETATVLVTLREQARPVVPAGADRRTRLRIVIDSLRATAERAQAPVLGRLARWADQGRVRSVRPLWVLDAVAVAATADVIGELARRPDVASVVPDDIELVPALGPAEPNQTQIAAPDLWTLGQTGQGVVVAVLDTGVDLYHPDLQPRWRGGTNSWFDPYAEHPTTPTDLSGHGTATAGAIVGGDAGGTTIGTAPGASWIAARVFNDRGGASTTAVHQAFQWLLDPDHDPATADAPRVVNASWSIGAGPGCDLTFQPDVQALRAAGILPVFAAGNFGPGGGSSVSPANYPESLAVGAVSGEDAIYSSSSRGPADCGGRVGTFPDLVAPGVGILTTDRYGLYQVVSGTSVAAPHAAGALALLLGERPDLTTDQQRAALTGTAVDLGTAGPDDTYGYGRLDVLRAHQSLPAPVPDFGLSVSPATAAVEAGTSTSFEVQVSPVNGFAGDVTLTFAGPAGQPVTGVFDPSVVAGGAGGSRLVVATSPLTTPGTYPLLLTGQSGSTSHTTTVTLDVTAPPPPPPPPPPPILLEFSTAGVVSPPGVADAPDDADTYGWDGTGFRRVVDASAAAYGLAPSANLDGFDRIDADRFYASFSADTPVPGLGTVQDEDVVRYDHGTWTMFFDGTARRLTSAAQDLDAISVVGSTLYFSTEGLANPPGVGGTADDADLYRWNGTSFGRVWDATSRGLGTGANVDGVVVTDATHFHLSFSPATTSVPGLGAVEDEDVVRYDAGAWSLWFDGTSRGLTSSALDIDAFDIP